MSNVPLMTQTGSEQDLQESDKVFWHGYLSFYEQHLPKDITGNIVEFGVLKGASIRWLLRRFPSADIIGVDIEPQKEEWPVDSRVTYMTVDQGRPADIARLFAEVHAPAMIIEDGSHIPSHRSSCLVQGMSALAPGGIYILEDIHTSHPRHELYERECEDEMGRGKRILRGLKRKLCPGHATTFKQTSLSVLLAFDHLKRLNRERLTPEELALLATGNHFNQDAILDLYEAIGNIATYRRSVLPRACYRCKRTSYRYHSFKCECGADLFMAPDSMSVFIQKNGRSLQST